MRGGGLQRAAAAGAARQAERPAHGDERGGSEVLAGIAAAVILIVPAQTAEAQAAQPVLVQVACAGELLDVAVPAPLVGGYRNA